MNLSNYYYYFKKALSQEWCNQIIECGLEKKQKKAVTLNKDSTSRDCSISWLNENWIYKELHPYVNEANKKANWNFQWDQSESIQFTIYKPNEYYNWHSDDYQDYETINKKQRKLSMSVSLSNKKDYEGGELEFDFRNLDPDKKRNIKKCKEIDEQGSVIVFPSFVYHRVTPVTHGIRYSLVMWSVGEAWK